MEIWKKMWVGVFSEHSVEYFRDTLDIEVRICMHEKWYERDTGKN